MWFWLRRGSWNLLAGRLVSASMHPVLAAELGVDFSLERALRFALVPLVWEAIDPEQSLRAWIAYRRTKAGREVDFVVYGPDRFTPEIQGRPACSTWPRSRQARSETQPA